MSESEIRISENATDLFRAAGLEFSALAVKSVRERGRFCIALSGGSTPKGLYSFLATGTVPVPWEKIYFFWGDERHVPPTDPESNYRMAEETMLSKVPVQPQNIFRIKSEEKDAHVAAEGYEKALITIFGVKNDESSFDLVLLGVGPDGHTASLFPGSAALQETNRLVVANWVEKFQTHRITLTLPIINRAASVIFLASGPEKAGILREVLEGRPGKYPSQLIRPNNGNLMWFVDKAAASQLSGTHNSQNS